MRRSQRSATIGFMPTGLESANLKVVRAAEHLAAIRFHVASYAVSKPHEIITQPDGKQKGEFTVPVPDTISVIAGEIIYQLRSALDHLVFDLVKLNPKGIPLHNAWFEQCDFPLLTKVPTEGKPPVPRQLPLPCNYWAKKLPGISTEAFTFIEQAQPFYNRKDDGKGLRYLAELSKIDKHRHLHVVAPRLSYNQRITIGRPFSGVDDGTELVKVEGSHVAYVSFDEDALKGVGWSVPIEDILQTCLSALKLIVIPAFTEFLKSPQ